jgi:amylosucrase
MPWNRAALRNQPGTLEHRVFGGLRAIISARKRLPSLHAAVESVVSAGSDPSILVVSRRHAAGDVIQIYNFAERDAWVAWDELGRPGNRVLEEISGRDIDATASGLTVAAYGVLWLTGVLLTS